MKTRLIPPLPTRSAAELHTAFVSDLIERLSGSEFDIELSTDHETDAWAQYQVTRSLQCGQDLGEKMLHALTSGLQRGREVALVLGSDSPTVPLEHLSAIAATSADVCLGPCDDGGFYAIAARRSNREMFRSVVWSQPDTLANTVAAMRACDLSTKIGAPWYDVDDAASLQRLLAETALPRHICSWISTQA